VGGGARTEYSVVVDFVLVTPWDRVEADLRLFSHNMGRRGTVEYSLRADNDPEWRLPAVYGVKLALKVD